MANPGYSFAEGFSLRCSIKLEKNGCLLELFCPWLPVTDPGFPRREASIPEAGTPAYYLAIFYCRKLHENERNWTKRRVGGEGGHTSLAPPPLDPPMVTTSIKML